MRSTTAQTRGVTLIDVIVGTSLMLVVFMGIFGILQLSTILIAQNKGKVGAVALANQQMETIRSTEYEDVGTIAGVPSGIFEQSTTTLLNNINYNINTSIRYIDDPADGTLASSSDTVSTDYKVARVEVEWTVKDVTRDVVIISNVIPPGGDEATFSTTDGSIAIEVIDANGDPVVGADVYINNPTVIPAVAATYTTNVYGQVPLVGAPIGNGYRTTVTKTGYNDAATYASGTPPGNDNPNPGYYEVFANAVTELSFAIDVLGDLTLYTFVPEGADGFEDLFDKGYSGLSATSGVVITSERLELRETSPGSGVYLSGGPHTAFSETISTSTIGDPALIRWGDFEWNDGGHLSTNVVYRVLHSTDGGSTYNPISETDLPGNTAGFSTSLGSSPVDLSGLDVSVFDDLQLGAYLNTTNTNFTPRVADWRLTYTVGPVPQGDVDVTLRGDKWVGTDTIGDKIYRDEAVFTTSSTTADVNLPEVTWGTYDIIDIDSATSSDEFDVARICPPYSLKVDPGETASSSIVFEAEDDESLLVFVVDALDDGDPVVDAFVELYKGTTTPTVVRSGTTTAASCGQIFFNGLLPQDESGDYSIDVSHPSLSATSTPIEIESGVGEVRIYIPLD